MDQVIGRTSNVICSVPGTMLGSRATTKHVPTTIDPKELPNTLLPSGVLHRWDVEANMISIQSA